MHGQDAKDNRFKHKKSAVHNMKVQKHIYKCRDFDDFHCGMNECAAKMNCYRQNCYRKHSTTQTYS